MKILFFKNHIYPRPKKTLLKVRKMTLNVWLKVVLSSYSIERRSNVIFLNLDRFFASWDFTNLPCGISHANYSCMTHLFIICFGKTNLTKFGFEWETVLLFSCFCGCSMYEHILTFSYYLQVTRRWFVGFVDTWL